MTYESIAVDQFQFGHDTNPWSRYEANSQSDQVKPFIDRKLHAIKYNQDLGDHDELDNSSQGSSDDTSSPSSDLALPITPLQRTSDDNPRKNKKNGQPYCEPLGEGASRPRAFVPVDIEGNTVSIQPEQLSYRGQCDAQSLPVRPKRHSRNVLDPLSKVLPHEHASLNQSTDNPATTALPLDSSCPPTDVRRSRARPVERGTPQEWTQSCRRRSNGTGVAPPRLRRDTDQTDTIVKMIVFFCVNLINSIWSPDSVCSDSPASPQQGSPVLPLQVFITETLRRSKTSYSTLQIALYYLILLKQMLPPPVSRQSGQGCRAVQCGRRMFLTALILASKYLQDRNYSARAWSKISGLPLKEINENERKYLSIICWDLHVPKDTFENWSKIVLNVCRQSMGPTICDPNNVESQSPGPGSGPSGPHCFLKGMCADKLAALRKWWLDSLGNLRTDVVRCPRRTEKYVNSLCVFRAASYLPRPVIDDSWRDELADPSCEETHPAKTLPRLPSIDSLSKYAMPFDQADSPAANLTLPPPPMLANLPTPQQTPRGTEMSSMWHQMSGPNLRCRASASALGNLDQRRCPSANLDRCPPPKPLPQSYSSLAYQLPLPCREVPDRSTTSSPAESVMSDTPSVFSYAPRSRSSSISSTVSTATSASSWSAVSDKDRLEIISRSFNPVYEQSTRSCAPQIATRRDPSASRTVPSCGLERIERPQTAFRVPHQSQKGIFENCPMNKSSRLAEVFTDETHGSDYLANQVRATQQEEEAAQALTALQTGRCMKQMLSKPEIVRSKTQMNDLQHSDCTRGQMLKRSRSGSLDCAHERVNSQDCQETFAFKQLTPQLVKVERVTPTSDWEAIIKKGIQLPMQPYLPPRMPIQSENTNKRFAVSAASQLASLHLRQELLQQG